MPRQTAQNPLYVGRYNDPGVAAIGNNIAALWLGGQSPYEREDAEAKAKLMGQQGASAEATARKTGYEADLLEPRVRAFQHPGEFATGAQNDISAQGQAAQGMAQTIYDLIVGGGNSNASDAGDARRKNEFSASMNRNGADFAGPLGIEPARVAERQSALKGDAPYDVSDNRVQSKFDKTDGLLTDLGVAEKAKTNAEAKNPSGGAPHPVTIQDPNDPNKTVVMDARSKEVYGSGPKLSEVGGVDLKLKKKMPQAKLRVDTMVNNINRLADDMQSLHDDPGLSRITGSLAGRTPNITNKATNAQNKLDSINSQIFVDALQSMREASKTGGAVGNVSDREGDKLERTIAGLNQSQGTPSFRDNLQKAIKQLHTSRDILTQAYQDEYGGFEGDGADSAAASAAPTAAAKVVKWGRDAKGNPVRLP